jgi:hypothetical protein
MRRPASLASTAALIGALVLASHPAGAAPRRIDLPDGSQPEGLAISRRGVFYTGSLADGTIFVGDVDTGRVRVLAPGAPGRSAVGVAVRGRYLWVAGGETGKAWVFLRSGRLFRTYDLGGGFVNDVVVTKRAAYLTDSFEPVLHRISIGSGGVPGPAAGATSRPLRGDIAYGAGFNANGIDVDRGTARLVLVQSNTGELFLTKPSGRTHLIDLGGTSVGAGDGLLLEGRTAFVVQNTLNQVATIELDADLRGGEVTGTTTDPGFDVPTSIDAHGSLLYVVNARFSTPPEADTPYWITGFARP